MDWPFVIFEKNLLFINWSDEVRIKYMIARCKYFTMPFPTIPLTSNLVSDESKLIDYLRNYWWRRYWDAWQLDR
jgi:hypothetical protein